MSKHTPRPWKVDRGRDSVSMKTTEEESYTLVASVYPCQQKDSQGNYCYLGNDESVREANCHLIAAAPDMLEALEALLNQSGKVYSGQLKAEAIDMAFDAIKKAKGEI